MEPLFMKPVFQDKIWGGNRLHSVFGFDLPSDKVGEDWAISAHPHGVSVVENGQFKGQKLNELWETQPQLFGHPQEPVFPLLIKILDAEDDLSVQVHPDDAYGLKHEGELGKTECWYIIDAEPGAEIIYGHHARTREELTEMIRDEKWSDLFTRVPVKKGDFYFVPAGTIHAIGKGIMILETQQSSDTTYRVYDYDRKDDQGQPRELHIQQSIDVTTIPGDTPTLQYRTEELPQAVVTTFVETPFFNVYRWDVSGSLTRNAKAPYTLMTCIAGSGQLVVAGIEYPLVMGSSCLIPNQIDSWEIVGDCQIIASEPGGGQEGLK